MIRFTNLLCEIVTFTSLILVLLLNISRDMSPAIVPLISTSTVIICSHPLKMSLTINTGILTITLTSIYRQTHFEWVRANNHRRRAYERNNGGTHVSADIQQQYKNQRGKCYYCKKKVGKTYHVDHVIPLSKGGSNGPENIVIACPRCNLRKNANIWRLL